MRLDGAEYRDGVLRLSTRDADAIRLAYTFQPGEYTIQRAKKKRSLDANAYAWVLIDKISAALRLPKEEVYRNAIKHIGGVSEIVCVKSSAVKKLCESWELRGIGWQTDTMESKIEGCTNVILYYGSSCYDTGQMAQLIDHLIQDAEALQIETLPPERLRAMGI